MKTLHFECELLSDIILNATSATAQTTQTLEYIPGAKFLGIVAKKMYKNDNVKNAAIFHSGKVRFGDAHLVANGVRTLHVPLDFMTAKKPKEEDKYKIWLNHFLTEEDRAQLSDNGIQLQQKRNTFFISDEKLTIDFVKSTSSYALKSAYDADSRRAQHQQMFGYNALKKGSTWQFSVDIDDELAAHETEIKEALLGEHGLGKSRSAQYGRVKIKAIEEIKHFAKEHTSKADTIILYAESNCCFLDEYGQYTVKPNASDLNLADATIDWTKSQIRHRVYAPWNVFRSTRDADRWIIEKGSVLHLTNIDISSEKVAARLAQGVGQFRAEGFGRFLVNPDFLCEKEQLLSKKEEKSAATLSLSPPTLTGKNKIIRDLLQSRQDKAESDRKIASNLANIDKVIFDKITASQWGQIRNMAQNVKDWNILKPLLFNDTAGFLRTGKRKDIWSPNAINTLADKVISLAKDEEKANYLFVFASDMAKIAQQHSKEN